MWSHAGDNCPLPVSWLLPPDPVLAAVLGPWSGATSPGRRRAALSIPERSSGTGASRRCPPTQREGCSAGPKADTGAPYTTAGQCSRRPRTRSLCVCNRTLGLAVGSTGSRVCSWCRSWWAGPGRDTWTPAAGCVVDVDRDGLAQVGIRGHLLQEVNLGVFLPWTAGDERAAKGPGRHYGMRHLGPGAICITVQAWLHKLVKDGWSVCLLLVHVVLTAKTVLGECFQLLRLCRTSNNIQCWKCFSISILDQLFMTSQ